jgi:FkbM family methyltransferase
MEVFFRRCIGGWNRPIQNIPIGRYRASAPTLAQLSFLHREIFVNLEYCFRSSSDTPLIFDCGSNIGIAILLFKTLYPRARIVGFEPAPTTLPLLQHNIAANRLADVTVHAVALGRETGTLSFAVDPNRPGLPTMGRTLNAPDFHTVSVPQARLSSYITEPVDLLKIDIEGGETEVFEELEAAGALSLVRQMFIEYHHHLNLQQDALAGFLARLERHGFGYQIRSDYITAARTTGQPAFQDLLIYAYQK